MKLHEDKFAFLNIINLIHEASGIRSDILEKTIMSRCCFGSWRISRQSCRPISKGEQLCIKHRKVSADFRKILI